MDPSSLDGKSDGVRARATLARARRSSSPKEENRSTRDEGSFHVRTTPVRHQISIRTDHTVGMRKADRNESKGTAQARTTRLRRAPLAQSRKPITLRSKARS